MSDDDQLTAEEQAALDSQRGAPEPEAPPEPAPEAPQEGAEEQEAPEGAEPPPEGDKRPQTVPHAALHAERVRRQEVERQAAEDRRKYEARFEELLKLVPQPAAQTGEAAPAIPDVQADPVGHIVGTLQQLGASQQQIQQAVEQQRAQQQQQQLVMAVQQRAGALEADYRAQNPEYDGAIAYLRQFRDRQLQAAGLSDPMQRAQQIAAETFQIAAAALQQGGNPAERLHRIAEASGWTKPAEQSAPGQPAFTQPQAPDPAARLRAVQQGQEQSRGLGSVRGNGPGPLTAQKLLDMDPENFDEVIKVMRSPAARRLMGA